MRLLASFLVACGVGCSVAEAVQPPDDAGSDAAPQVDAGPEASPEAGTTPRACPGEPVSPACVPIADPCDGGTRYACYGSICPTGAMGACTVAVDKPLAQYAEVCCEKSACARNKFRDTRCVEFFDAGPMEGWDCPRTSGTPEPVKGKTCFAHGALPASGNAPGEYCCR